MKLEQFSDILNSDMLRDAEVTSLVQNSRHVVVGSLFFALNGTKADGAKFAQDAALRGAIAVVTGRDSDVGDVYVPIYRVQEPRRALALCAARLYNNQPETIIAVTGTSGKTSVAGFVRQIWAYAGLAAASIGTTGIVSPHRNDYGTLTTPDPIALHILLKELSDHGVTHGAIEASSHGLDQFRLDGVRLSAGAFTNLGRDHLDYHLDVTAYLNAKLRLFKELLAKDAPAIIFSDDPFSQNVIDAATQAHLRVLTVGRLGKYVSLKSVVNEHYQQRVQVEHNGHLYNFTLPLAGEFQMNNALVAAGLCIATGVESKIAFTALENLKGVSGRLELIGNTKSGGSIYVDYAHKPEALENVLTSVRAFTKNRVLIVFGCGGDRDKGKRAIMGEISARLADIVIVTDDNPRTENAQNIRFEIMKTAINALEIPDRATAIAHAVRLLQVGDTLIVAGKGHETGQIIGNVMHHFSDHEEILKLLNLQGAS
jgi:UDP-N-acetylmuramoyl-L-alanyl-D-glutamate--2,6-diaminopimelate ligase